MIEIKAILKDIWADKTRMILTILAIAWATAAITIMLAMGEGLGSTFTKMTTNVGQGVVILKSGQTTIPKNGVALNSTIQFSHEDYQAIRKSVAGIQRISPEYEIYSKMSYQHQQVSATIMAVNLDYKIMRDINIAPNGRYFDALDMQQKRRVIILGEQLQQELFGKRENPIGKSILVGQQTFIVIGIMPEKIRFTEEPYDDRALIPESTYVMLAQPKTIPKILITVKNIKQREHVKTAIHHLIANRKQINTNDSGIVRYHDFAKIQEETASIFSGLEAFLGLVGSLTLIVAGIGIANVMFIAIKRSTRSIGVRMALGARPHHIVTHYLLEALLACVIGGILGIIFSEWTLMILNKIPLKSEFFNFIQRPQLMISNVVFAVVLTLLALIGLIAGLIPALKAAKIHPAEALRHE